MILDYSKKEDILNIDFIYSQESNLDTIQVTEGIYLVVNPDDNKIVGLQVNNASTRIDLSSLHLSGLRINTKRDTDKLSFQLFPMRTEIIN